MCSIISDDDSIISITSEDKDIKISCSVSERTENSSIPEKCNISVDLSHSNNSKENCIISEDNSSVSDISHIQEICSVSDKSYKSNNQENCIVTDIYEISNKEDEKHDIKEIYIDKYKLKKQIQNNEYIELAVLSNLKDETDECLYENFMLPVLNIKYNSFLKLVFIERKQNFSIYLFDILYKKLKFSLINEFFNIFEKKTSIDRNTINPIYKIGLIKECCFKNLSTIVQKITALNKSDFILALNSINPIEKNEYHIKVIYKIYSKSLNVGINLVFRLNLFDSNICRLPEEIIYGDDNDEQRENTYIIRCK